MKMKANAIEMYGKTCSLFNWMTVVTNFICFLIWNLCVYDIGYTLALSQSYELFGFFFHSENSISWKWRERGILERKEARAQHHSLHLYAICSSASFGIHFFLNRQCRCNSNEFVLCCSTFHWATQPQYVHSNEHIKT